MSVFYEFDEVNAFTVGTVGRPGERTFLIQVRTDDQRVTVKCEKQQTAAIVQYLRRVLADLPPAEKLRWALENHAVTMMDHLDLVAVYLHEYRNLPPERMAEALAVRKHYEQVLTQIVEDGIAAGEFRSVNVKMAVFGMLGMLNWTHQWFSPDGAFSSHEVAATLAGLAMHGLAVPAGS